MLLANVPGRDVEWQNPPMDDAPRDADFVDRSDGALDAFEFSLHGRNGRVAVDFGPNDDPGRWGFGLLGLPWPTELAIGLPVLEARVSYPGEGYVAAMGWIQVVRIHVDEQSSRLVTGGEKAPAGDHEWVDGPPSLRGLGVPFVSFGPRPTLFDAPASTESDVRFVADSFLTASPDAVVSRRSRPCLGLRWGYATQAGSASELLAPSALGPSDWRGSLPVLAEHFPDWSFDSSWFD